MHFPLLAKCVSRRRLIPAKAPSGLCCGCSCSYSFGLKASVPNKAKTGELHWIRLFS